MKRSRLLLAVCMAAFAVAIPALQAQQNSPHLAYVLPAGGQPGTTFEVKVGGHYLQNVTRVYVTGGDVQAAMVEYTRPMNAMQAMQLRERMQELQKQPMNEAVRKEMTDIRVKLLMFNSTRNTSPVLAETATLRITMNSEAEPGKRELRVMTPQG